MEHKTSALYVWGGLAILTVSLLAYFVNNNSGVLMLGPIGIIYVLYHLNILTRNEIAKSSLLMLLIATIGQFILDLGVTYNLWPSGLGVELAGTSTTLFFFGTTVLFVLGFCCLVAGLPYGAFRKK